MRRWEDRTRKSGVITAVLGAGGGQRGGFIGWGSCGSDSVQSYYLLGVQVGRRAVATHSEVLKRWISGMLACLMQGARARGLRMVG